LPLGLALQLAARVGRARLPHIRLGLSPMAGTGRGDGLFKDWRPIDVALHRDERNEAMKPNRLVGHGARIGALVAMGMMVLPRLPMRRAIRQSIRSGSARSPATVAPANPAPAAPYAARDGGHLCARQRPCAHAAGRWSDLSQDDLIGRPRASWQRRKGPCPDHSGILKKQGEPNGYIGP
jgi:hypothetical protein